MLRSLLFGALSCAIMTAQATAADLGGKCCADLEERIAELEAIVARKGNRKVSLEVSGQVNAAILFLEDEEAAITGSNPNSQSRFRFVGRASVSKNVSAGYLLEFGVSDDLDSYDLAIRHSHVWIEDSRIGRITLGRASQSHDGALEMDLSGASGSTTMNLALIGGSVGDGSRKDLVRYDTPAASGFRLSASWADDESWDITLRGAKEFGGFQVIGAVFYAVDDIEAKSFGGSVSIMHVTSGIYLNAAASRIDPQDGALGLDLNGDGTDDIVGLTDNNLDHYGGRLGLLVKLNEMGKTNVFIEGAVVKFGSDDLRYYGLGLEQNIDAAAATLYANVRMTEGDGFDDFVSGVVGMKLRF